MSPDAGLVIVWGISFNSSKGDFSQFKRFKSDFLIENITLSNGQ